MTASWGGDPLSKTVIIDGDRKDVSSTSDLVDMIGTIAEEKGLSKFKVYVDDAEVSDPDDMDLNNVADGATIKVSPFDKAADEDAETDEEESDEDESETDEESETEDKTDAEADKADAPETHS